MSDRLIAALGLLCSLCPKNVLEQPQIEGVTQVLCGNSLLGSPAADPRPLREVHRLHQAGIQNSLWRVRLQKFSETEVQSPAVGQ